MRVLVAPDDFKGTLTAGEAATAIARGWRRHDTAADLDLVPMSDGGPGFLEVLHEGLGGSMRTLPARDPLGEPWHAEVLRGPDGTVYVEAARVCGLHLLPPSARRPLEATTVGVGDLLRGALAELAPTRVVVGVGGTASTDGGRGCVEALGSAHRRRRWPSDVPLLAATDVDNPLLGPSGAAAVFAPQKGAGRAEVAELERRLARWAEDSGGDPSAAGAGAGGGLGFGLLLLGGRRVSGVQLVLDALGLEARATAADLVVTGEGCFDRTSLQGKVPKGVAWVAQRAGRPCVVIAGRVLVARREYAAAGIDAAYAVEDVNGSADAAGDRPGERLSELAERVARTWDPRPTG